MAQDFSTFGNGKASRRLEPGQAANLRRMAFIQSAIFEVLGLSLGGIGVAGVAAVVSGTFQRAGTPPGMLLVLLPGIGLFLFAGLVFIGLSVATLLFAVRVANVAVHAYEGPPIKKTFAYRQSANVGAGGSMLSSSRTSGAWLLHDGRKFAVDLDLFRQIPDQGRFRFHYVRRPGFPGLLVPRLVVAFEPIAAHAGSEADAACACMDPAGRAEIFSIVPLGTDKTNGRFGTVSIATCNLCGQKWLRYQVEYEAFGKSGRWYRGLLPPDAAQTPVPESAVDLLGRMDWYFAGGSYFDSPGLRTSGLPAVDP